jgi:hypothetical protein
MVAERSDFRNVEDITTVPTRANKDMHGHKVVNLDDPEHPLDAVNLRTLNKALANAVLPTIDVENV